MWSTDINRVGKASWLAVHFARVMKPDGPKFNSRLWLSGALTLIGNTEQQTLAINYTWRYDTSGYLQTFTSDYTGRTTLDEDMMKEAAEIKAAAEAAPIDESPADDNSTKTDKSDEPEVKSRDDQK